MHHLDNRRILNEEIVDIVIINNVSSGSYITHNGRTAFFLIPAVFKYSRYSLAHILTFNVLLFYLRMPINQSILDPLKIKIGQALNVDFFGKRFFGFLKHVSLYLSCGGIVCTFERRLRVRPRIKIRLLQ